MQMTSTVAIQPLLSDLIAFTEEAGALALRYRQDGLAITYKCEGLGQALTQADLAISRLLQDRFGPRVIEEETAEAIGYADARRMLAEEEWSFVADPIDGTKPYSSGLPGWGTMIAACRYGWPTLSVLSLPAWFDDRTEPARIRRASEQRGILLAASEGVGFWSPTQGGRRTQALQPVARATHRTHHVAWQPGMAQRYTLDYESGYFPWCESASITEAALIATGRLDATPLNSSLWDTAPLLPLLWALGLDLYRWPDLIKPNGVLIDLVDKNFSGRQGLWLACRDRDQAAGLAAAIRFNPAWRGDRS